MTTCTNTSRDTDNTDNTDEGQRSRESPVLGAQLDEMPSTAPDFDGETYVAAKDKRRLSTLLTLVRRFMSDGLPHTLGEIHKGIDRGSEASISARLRDLRKEKFGGQTVLRRRRGDPHNGLWEYVLVKASAETEHGEKWEGVR